jgi:hypothetical protein
VFRKRSARLKRRTHALPHLVALAIADGKGRGPNRLKEESYFVDLLIVVWNLSVTSISKTR